MCSSTDVTTQVGEVGLFSAECPKILKHPLDHLLASAISLEIIRERGYESALGKKGNRLAQRYPTLATGPCQRAVEKIG